MLHVVHHPDYVVATPDGTHRFSKYALVMDVLRAGGNLTEHRPEPMPRAWIAAVHDADYVDAVLTAAVAPLIERRIGFPVTPAIARRSQLSVGGTYLAALLALDHGYAANAAGGSHHADVSGGAGYCVFNDLVVAANRLIAERRVARVLIVDVDVHQGDGTARMTENADCIATLSAHAERNYPVRKARSTIDVPLGDATTDAAYIAMLKPALETLLDDFAPEIVLYQGGVDVHRDDKLGRLALSDTGIAARDTLVAGATRARAIPLAGTLGGGYGNDVHAIAARHAAVMRSCAAAYFG